MPGNPLGLQPDDLVFEQSSGPRTAALLGHVSGTDLHLVDVAGEFGRELSGQGEPAMLDFARNWLAAIFGSDVKQRDHAQPRHALERGALGARRPVGGDARQCRRPPGVCWSRSAAASGSPARRCMRRKWGTVDGAWESGERAAVAALDQMGMLKKAQPERPSRRPRERERPSHRGRRRRRND